MFFEISFKNLVVFMHVNQTYLIIAIFSTIWNFSSAARHKYRPNFPQSIPCKPYQGTRYLFKNTGRFYKLFWCWRRRILKRNYSALGSRHLLDCQAHSELLKRTSCKANEKFWWLFRNGGRLKNYFDFFMRAKSNSFAQRGNHYMVESET